MPVRFSIRNCIKCHRQYSYWKDKKLFNSTKYCPDCNISRKSKEILGLPIELLPDNKKPPDRIWADKQVIRLMIKTAGLTDKQRMAVKDFISTNKIPRQPALFCRAIKKMRKAGKGIFK